MKKEEKRFCQQVGRRIAAAQKAAGISDARLSSLAECATTELKDYKAGKIGTKSYRLALLAKALQVDVSELVPEP